MNLPLISIIIPVYKVEKYLDQCMKSVVNQTYSNLEILLVDDGSPDNCPQMCDEWAQKDTRIRVIHKQNSGLSDARNTASVQANGKYITFVDSDDCIHRCYVELLYSAIQNANAEIAVCNLISFDKEIPMDIQKKTQKYIYSSVDALETMLYQKKFDTSAPSKMFSAELTKEFLFPKGRLYEDLFTIYKMMYAAHRIAYVDSNLYYYRNNPESIMHLKFTKRMYDAQIAVDEIVDFCKKNEPEILSAALSRKFSNYSQILRWSKNAPASDALSAKQKELWKFIKDYRWPMLWDSQARIKNRLGALISYLGMKIYIHI